MSHSFALIFLYMSTLYQLPSCGTHSSASFSFISTHPPAHPLPVLLALSPLPADVQGDDVAPPLAPSLPPRRRAEQGARGPGASRGGREGHWVRWSTGSTVGVRMRPRLCSTRLWTPLANQGCTTVVEGHPRPLLPPALSWRRRGAREPSLARGAPGAVRKHGRSRPRPSYLPRAKSTSCAPPPTKERHNLSTSASTLSFRALARGIE
jgi:hypothetical protein